MGRWAGKYVIGLTGNIGTGKSVVRRMLEHLGAYGIDADALGHRVIARGAPGYQPVVATFGSYVVGQSGEIDRARLGRVAFADPEAMILLEKIIHPFVEQAVDIMIRRASQPVVVIEAIKLLETASLVRSCDSVWVSITPRETQLQRLVQNRKMSESEARQRIAAQPPQESRVAAAQMVIKNDGSFEDTWRQVVAGWKKLVPVASQDTAPVAAQPAAQAAQAGQGELSVVRARPRHSQEIAEIINRARKSAQPVRKDDIMAAFGEKAFLLLQMGQSSQGVIGWQVENLVARTTDIFLDPGVPVARAIPALVVEMERASKDLQCEASLIFVPQELAQHDAIWKGLGYERRPLQSLSVLAWQEAAKDSLQPNTVLLFKQLRVDRILRPI